jgi:rubrerythrin
MSAGKQKMEMPVPRSREGWLTANVGGMRVLNLLGFILCGARFERDIYDKGKFKGRVKYAQCSRGGEYAKMTMYVHVEYDDGDVQKLDLEQLTECSWRMDGMLRQELIGQVVRFENGLNAVVRIFEQQQFRVVLQADPLSPDGFGINEVVMSLQEVMTCLIRFWQKEFVRLVGIERVSDPFVKTLEQKEANNGTEVEAQRMIRNGSQEFFNAMYNKMAENIQVEKDATDKVNRALADAQRNHEAPQTCSVCLVEKVNRVLIPCGHIVLCGGCADTIIAVAPRRCPICREEIVWSHQVVFPS